MQQYLNEMGEYVFQDSVGGVAAVKMAGILEARQIPINSGFCLNVDGITVTGHTLKDPSGRWAMEWETAGRWDRSQETIEQLERPVVREWKLKPAVRRPIVAAPTRPWWKFW